MKNAHFFYRNIANNKMYILVLLFILVIVVLYSYFYLKPPRMFNIIQLPIDQLHPQYLFEKNPIIVNESLHDPNDLSSRLFKWLYVSQKTLVSHKDYDIKTWSRYAVVHPTQGTCFVQIRAPYTYQTIDVKLRQNQILVLPYLWQCNGKGNEIRVTFYHDIISLFFGKIFGSFENTK